VYRIPGHARTCACRSALHFKGPGWLGLFVVMSVIIIGGLRMLLELVTRQLEVTRSAAYTVLWKASMESWCRDTGFKRRVDLFQAPIFFFFWLTLLAVLLVRFIFNSRS
jgi:hypothetical protein